MLVHCVWNMWNSDSFRKSRWDIYFVTQLELCRNTAWLHTDPTGACPIWAVCLKRRDGHMSEWLGVIMRTSWLKMTNLLYSKHKESEWETSKHDALTCAACVTLLITESNRGRTAISHTGLFFLFLFCLSFCTCTVFSCCVIFLQFEPQKTAIFCTHSPRSAALIS